MSPVKRKAKGKKPRDAGKGPTVVFYGQYHWTDGQIRAAALKIVGRGHRIASFVRWPGDGFARVDFRKV